MENTFERVWISELVLNVSDQVIWGMIRTRDQERDSILLALSRHSITSAALSPVNCRISFRWGSSTTTSVNLLTSSSRSKSPASSFLTLGRESTRSNTSEDHEEAISAVVLRISEGGVIVRGGLLEV